MQRRLTVGRLAFWVGASAMACGALFAAHSDWIWGLFAAYPLVLLTRRGRPTARWCPAVLALAVAAESAGGVRDVVVYLMAGIAVVFVLVISPFVIRRGDGRLHRPAAIVLVISLIAMASAPPTAWPLRLSFLASHREFDGFARALESGYRMTGPERVGRFLILKAELRDGRPCLWVDSDPAGYDGFVRNPRRGSNGKLLGRSNLTFNLWSAVRLDDDWAFISED